MTNATLVLSEFKPDPNAGIGAQITSFLRDAIVAGDIEPGSKLPPTGSLVKRWGTHAPTVQAALTPLVKEGLLDRTPGRGTFVRRASRRLTQVGVYLTAQEPKNRAGEAWRVLAAELQHALSAAGVETIVWSDPRSQRAQRTPLPELDRACAERRVQGIIALPLDRPKAEWLRKLPVPVTCFASANMPARVYSDAGQFAELALRALSRQGCRSVGLVSVLPTDVTQPDGSRHPDVAFYERFFDVAGELRMVTRNAWIHAWRHDGKIASSPTVFERFGYEGFKAIWGAKECPDGLVVFEDTASRGVVQAVLEGGVRVPDELKLVLYRNREVGFHCPVPATFVEISMREAAEALIAQIRKQVRGEACAPIAVPYRLVE